MKLHNKTSRSLTKFRSEKRKKIEKKGNKNYYILGKKNTEFLK